MSTIADVGPSAIDAARRSRRRRRVRLFLAGALAGCLVAFWMLFGPLVRRALRRDRLLRLAQSSGDSRAANREAPPAPFPLDDATTHYLPIVTSTLPNGLRVVILPDNRLPQVKIQMRVAAGTAYDGQEWRPGAADTACSMFAGAESRPGAGDAPGMQFEALGTSIDETTYREDVIFDVSGLSEQTAPFLRLFARSSLHPDATPQEMDMVRASALEAERSNRSAPQMQDTLTRAVLCANTPFAAPPASARQKYSLITDDIKEFYDDHYRPESTILGVEGDVDPTAVLAEIRNDFGSWQRGPHPVRPPDHRFPTAKTRLVHLVDWPNEKNAYLSVRALAADDSSPDMPALYVANQIFGGSSSGRLFQNIREVHEMTYGSYAHLVSQTGGDIWHADVTVTPDDAPEALARILAEIHDLQRHEVSPGELARAKNAAIGAMILSAQKPGYQMDQTVYAMGVGLNPDFYRVMPERIQAVTAAQVRDVARRYLSDDGLQMVVVGSAKVLADDLSVFAPLRRYDQYGRRTWEGTMSANASPKP